MHRLLRIALSRKKLTFLYVPDNASVRQFLLPRWVLHVGALGLFVMLGLAGFFGSRYLSAAAEGRYMLELRGENVHLRGRLSRLEQQLGQLTGEMEQNQEMEKRLRLMASLEETDPEVLEAGVGGPTPLASSTWSESPELREKLEVADSRLNQLLRQAKMQQESYEEIVLALAKKRDTWDRTPSVRPVSYGTITSKYGRRMDPFTGQTAMHRGLDIAARPGSPIRATAKGVVTMASRWGGYGLMVEINHGGGVKSRYAHCQASLVKPGQKVDRGDVIARVGSTGKSSGSHVHYEVLKSGLQLNPMDFILPADVVLD